MIDNTILRLKVMKRPLRGLTKNQSHFIWKQICTKIEFDPTFSILYMKSNIAVIHTTIIFFHPILFRLSAKIISIFNYFNTDIPGSLARNIFSNTKRALKKSACLTKHQSYANIKKILFFQFHPNNKRN